MRLKRKLFTTLFCLGLGTVAFGQGPTSTGVYPVTLNSSNAQEYHSVGDINSKYTTISKQYATMSGGCGRDLYLFNAATGVELTSPYYSWDHNGTTKVLFDPSDDNVVYTLYVERVLNLPLSSTERRTYIRRFEFNGTSFNATARKDVFSQKTQGCDFVVAPNGDVLVGSGQSDGSVRVNVLKYNGTSMALQSSTVVSGASAATYPAQPGVGGGIWDISMDMKADKFIIAHNVGSWNSTKVNIKRYQYTNPGINLINDYTRWGQKLHTYSSLDSHNSFTQNLALKPNGDIFYLNSDGLNWAAVKLAGAVPIVSVMTGGLGHANIVTSDNSKTLIASHTSGGLYTIAQYTAADAFDFTHYVCNELRYTKSAIDYREGLDNLSIYECDIMACGEDARLGTNIQGDNLYFETYTCCREDCCPKNLTMEVDCENGLVTISGISSNATVNYTTWYYSKKTPSQKYGHVIQTGDGLISSTTANANGYYTVEIQFTMPNGEVCTIIQTIYYDSSACCEENGPQANAIFGGDPIQLVTPYGTFPVYQLCQNGRLELSTIAGPCEIERHMLSGAPFNPFTWTIDPWQFTTGQVSGTPPAIMDLETINGGPLALGYYWIEYAVSSPWDFKYIIIEIIECDPVGKSANLTEALSTADVTLAPNPANEQVNVIFAEEQSGQVTVLSAEGKQLSSIDFKDKVQLDLNTANLPAGLYWVNITLGDQVISKKLIKQ
ncbi:MAG: T9SS type A sorting domain-containing protein [Crocinitomicaceae bacterium]|nr:T9SS type A sorting domain-containing protein [Flavobacteriales bacterium]NQZ34836.1 T9SS type A sorting domain-containing protein [Crocinitomicaceae bacterium]